MKIKALLHSLKIENWSLKISDWFVTDSERHPEISETRDISTTKHRDTRLPARQQLRSCGRAADGGHVTPEKLVMESLSCPYCQSANFVKKGFRMKKRERVQLYQCLSCRKVFTPRSTKGKHYPLAIMLDAISIYNLGYSLEATCRIIQVRSQKAKVSSKGGSASGGKSESQNSKLEDQITQNQKTASSEAVIGDLAKLGGTPIPRTESLISQFMNLVKGSGPDGTRTRETNVLGISSQPGGPTPNPVSHINLQASTLAAWLKETEELCRFSRMREYAIKKFSPKEMVITATLAHRQLYRFRFHRGKCNLIIREEYGHRKFTPLQDYLELVPAECPHQYFSQGLRASEAPLTFSKTAMIVRGKTNYATRLAAFVLQSVSDRKARHEAIQKFMLANDSVTVASEVPVYLTRDDIEHMKTQLGFEIYDKDQLSVLGSRLSDSSLPVISPSVQKTDKQKTDEPKSENGQLKTDNRIILPKLITGHIDLLQIRNGQIHILDYKPNAEKERPIEQLTLYAMALSRLTGLRLFEFKCAWFDEKDYFEFYPLHVLHKPKNAQRRRKVYTMEGMYNVNKDEKKVEAVRPITL